MKKGYTKGLIRGLNKNIHKSRSKFRIRGKWIRRFGMAACLLLVFFGALAVHPVVPEPIENAEAAVNAPTTTLNVTTSGSAAVLDVTPNSTSGTFSSSDTSGTSLGFSVTTNNITGYNLSISHADATTPAPLVNEDLSTSDTTVALESLSSGTSITESEFNTSTYVGRYGYRPSMLNSETNSKYIPAPTVTATTLNVTSQANATDASDDYTIALGANIDYTKSAGTYTNTFTLAVVANNVAYTIDYKDNTDDSSVSNLPTAESSSTAKAASFILSSTTPTRTGYTFAGWCYGTVTHNATGNDICSSSTASDSSAAGDGQTYSAGSTFSFANYSTSTNVANLYAMWNVKTYSLAITFAGEGVSSVQVRTGSGTSGTLKGTVSTSGGSVSGLTYNTKYYLYPTFSSSYTLDSWSKTSSTGTLSSTTSTNPTFTMGAGNGAVKITGKTSLPDLAIQDVTSSTCTTTAQDVYDKRDNQVYKIQKLADGKCWLLDNLRLGYTGFASGVTTLDSTNTNTTNSIATSTFTGWNRTSGFTSYNYPMINTASADNATTGYGSGSKKVGVYYNYCAATMQSYCMAQGSGSGNNASQDVCPKGWRMPTGGSNGEYQALYTAYSSNATNFRNALSTPLSGYFYDSSARSQGSYGDFWSSTYGNGDNMYGLSVYSSDVYPQSYKYRNNGYSVRCVLETRTITDVTYMQDVTPTILANTAEGATATLIDQRDNQSYLVGKLADGKLWMLDNLRLGSSTLVQALSTSNTNMSSSVAFTLPASSSSGFISYNTAMINTDYANTTTTRFGSGSGKIGVFYNYCAASAGTYCYASGSGSGNASYDVCPAGWRMPTGGPSGEYQALCDKIKGSSCGSSWSDNQIFKAALSTPLSGYFYNSYADFQGSYGYFWSSTYYRGYNMYYLHVNSSNVLPQDNIDSYYGFSVRCVLK